MAIPTGDIQQAVQCHHGWTCDCHLERLRELPGVGVRVVALHRAKAEVPLPASYCVHKAVQHCESCGESKFTTWINFLPMKWCIQVALNSKRPHLTQSELHSSGPFPSRSRSRGRSATSPYWQSHQETRRQPSRVWNLWKRKGEG